ncbi:MAG: leucine-rich repeat protein [Rikenellaceae bacterium]
MGYVISRRVSLEFLYLESLPEYAISAAVIARSSTSETSVIETLYSTSITSVGAYAFYTCTSLVTVNLPSAHTVGDYAFYGCTSLTTVILGSASSSSSGGVRDTAFDNCGALAIVKTGSSVSHSGSTISSSQYSGSDITSITAYEATYIGDYAFYNCTSFSTGEMPKVEIIGIYAFGNCYVLPSLYLPLCYSIGEGTFLNCTSFTTVDLPALKAVANLLFSGCTSLSTLSLPVATSVGSTAFKNCSKLTSLSLATSSNIMLTSVATDAFSGVATTNISLTIGVSNRGYINGNTLTVGSFSATFKEIIVVDGNGNIISSSGATGNDATGTGW